MKKHVYRVGDTIRVLRPRVVDRVGYPKSWYDYRPKDDEIELIVAERLLRGVPLEDALKNIKSIFGVKSTETVPVKVLSLAAYLRAKEDGFGGKTRSIHFKDLDYWPDSIWSSGWPLVADTSKFKPFKTKVRSKRRVVTGDYYPAWSSHDSYTGEYDYEPGGLENAKHHVIIMTDYGEFHTDDIEPIKEENESTSKNY